MSDVNSLPSSEANPFQSGPDCLICQFYTCNLYLRCAVHPTGVDQGHCPDYIPLGRSPQAPGRDGRRG